MIVFNIRIFFKTLYNLTVYPIKCFHAPIMAGCWWWLWCGICDCRRKPYQFPHLFQTFQPRDGKNTIEIQSYDIQSAAYSNLILLLQSFIYSAILLIIFPLPGLSSVWKQYQTSNAWYAGSLSARHKQPKVIWLLEKYTHLKFLP